MKKNRCVIAFFTFLYLILAVVSLQIIKNIDSDANHAFRVDMHRIYAELEPQIIKKENSNQIIIYQPSDYPASDYVKNVSYLSAKIKDADIIQHFYETKNSYQMEIMPIMQDNCVIGYLRFDYIKQIDALKYIVLAEIFLFVVYLSCLVIFCYINQKILKPFHQIKDMPYELAKGNFTQSVNENQNKYFGKFIWGINMLKDALESHKRKELRLTKEKKMMVLSISHDVKTPLNAINLYAKALEEEVYKTREEKQKAVRKIQEKAEEINGFVQELIQSSTEDILEIEVKNGEFYLEDLTEKIILGYQEKCNLNHVILEVKEWENVLLKGDMDRAYEAVCNLMENAFKYGDGQKITLFFSEEEYCILLHIKNTGTPVSEHEMAHLFDGFFRGSNAQTRQGNGLGLYICREIMRKMGGDIYAIRQDFGMEFVLVFQIC